MTALHHKGFVPMFYDQINSPAFICLNPVAKVMYLILRQEYKGDYTGNDIVCPYNTFVEKGISRNSIADNLRQLEALGFVTLENGGLYHQPNHYHFTNGWQAFIHSLLQGTGHSRQERPQSKKNLYQ